MISGWSDEKLKGRWFREKPLGKNKKFKTCQKGINVEKGNLFYKIT